MIVVILHSCETVHQFCQQFNIYCYDTIIPSRHTCIFKIYIQFIMTHHIYRDVSLNAETSHRNGFSKLFKYIKDSAMYGFNAGADLGNYGWGGSSLCKQGRSPWSRDEVPSGRWVWEGGVPPPYLEENLNKRLFRCLLKHSKLHIIMCIFHTKRANIWHPMKPNLYCDVSNGECYITV